MKTKLVILSFFVFFILSFNYSCEGDEGEIIRDGEKLAHIHCISCHAFPDPSLLDKKTWGTEVLPKMAELMYVENYYNPFNASGPDGDMPAERQSSEELFPYTKWEKIVKYYVAAAPRMPLERTEVLSPIQAGLKNFSSHYLHNKINHPVSTMVFFDTTGQKIFFADGNAGKIFVTNTGLKVTDTFFTGVGVTDIHLRSNGITAISMGILKPSDAKLGRLELLKENQRPVILIDSLRRPVHANYADLNSDGKEDIIICEFGFRQGSLAWFENKDDEGYKKHLLKALPGAIRTEVFDFNEDGKPDIAALMAQGDEGVFIFYNEGNGAFREDPVLRFPPTYGSNYFQLYDFNKDGLMDIITTNGDNGDYSVILKPYHGIRIFYNTGGNKFEEKAFLPVNGIQKAMPADFDNDGDIDIASIAFFPDYENLAEESFIFWENNGNNTYERYTFNGFADGRWMTMDVGDADSDGDKDILLGNAFFTLGIVPKAIKDKWQKKPVSLVLLENTLLNK